MLNNSDNSRRQSQPGQHSRPFDDQPREIVAKTLPAKYIEEAEKVIQKISESSKPITTNKIRNLLSMLSDIYNKENLRTEKILLPESVNGLTMFRIRSVYEAGRDDGVKDFVFKSNILSYAKSIENDRQKLIDFSHYMEALVAYHRFYISRKEG